MCRFSSTSGVGFRVLGQDYDIASSSMHAWERTYKQSAISGPEELDTDLGYIVPYL